MEHTREWSSCQGSYNCFRALSNWSTHACGGLWSPKPEQADDKIVSIKYSPARLFEYLNILNIWLFWTIWTFWTFENFEHFENFEYLNILNISNISNIWTFWTCIYLAGPPRSSLVSTSDKVFAPGILVCVIAGHGKTTRTWGTLAFCQH